MFFVFCVSEFVEPLLQQKYTKSGLKLLGLDLASLATQGVCAGAQPNAYTGYGISGYQSSERYNRLLYNPVIPAKAGI